MPKENTLFEYNIVNKIKLQKKGNYYEWNEVKQKKFKNSENSAPN